MPTSSPMKKTIELQANTSTPHGATIRLTVEYRIRPSVSPESGPVYEGVQIQQHVDANLGPTNDQYQQRADYTYATEHDRSIREARYSPFDRTTDSQSAHTTQQPGIYDSEKIIEHISEDEKSTSSEEVVFEEWTEEFKCRRTDEYDGKTNQLLRTTFETGDRKKGDVIKEQYKEKNTRVRAHKSYDSAKEIRRHTPVRTYEEIPRPPPRSSSIPPRASSADRQWTSEDIYTTEIVHDPTIVRDLESTAQKFESTTHYERAPAIQTSISTRYDHMSNVVTTPSAQYAEQRKKEQPEDVVCEEYQVEIERESSKQDKTSADHLTGTYITTGSQPPTRRTDDWRNKLKEIYNPTSDEDQLESPKKISSTSPTDDEQPRSSSTVTEQRTPYEPAYRRVGDLKNAFETASTTYGSTRDDLTKYKTPISTSFTEQRRRIFEDPDYNRRPINEFQSSERRLSETHTGPSLVSNRVSRFENTQSTPQTSIDIKYRSKQVISSMDSDLSGPTQPIYQSTPKSYKLKQDEDAGHESEDELSDPKQSYDIRRRTSKTRLRDFSQSTQQPIDVLHTVHRATTTLDNLLTQVPITKSKSPLIEPSTHSPSKSHLTSDSGVFDYSATATSYQLPSASTSLRQNISTTIVGDTPRSRDNAAYADSTIISSPYGRRQTSDIDQTTTQNIDESISRSTYQYNREIPPTQYQQQHQQRTVRRQLTNSPPTEYEHLTSYQSRLDSYSKVPITTQSRTIKPLVVDEYETVETKTQVDCQVQRTNEIKESTTTERIGSPSRKILTITTTATASTSHSPDETASARRVLLNERPQYYGSPKDERRFQPIQRDHSQGDVPRSSTMEVTSLSPTDQIKFGKKSPNEIVAVVRVPELSKPPIYHGTSESNIYEKSRVGGEDDRSRLHYQRVHATSYRPPIIPQVYQSRQSRSRYGPFENANDYSSPITLPVRSTSSYSNLYEQNQQQQQQQQPISRPQTRYHSGSLGNLLGSNLEFEIEIEKRPPQLPEQPTSVSLDQSSRAVVTTSKDGRVSVQNIPAYPGNTIVINSDYHSSDRSLNRSSGYFSSDEPRSQGGHTTNYSSDEQSSGAYRNSPFTSSPIRQYRTNEQTPINTGTRYRFDRVNEIVQNYSRSPNNFNDAIDQIDALYTNLDVQKNEQRPYDFSKLNRRKQLVQNPSEYANRYTSTGFQQIPYEQPTISSVVGTPLRPSQSLSSSGVLTDYGTPGSGYGSIQNLVVQQNRLNGQSQIVQRNRASVKQVKQKNAAKRRNGNLLGQYSDGDDDDEENDSPLSDNGRSQLSPQSYNYYP